YTAFHPVNGNERFVRGEGVNEGFHFALSKSAPVTIGNNAWIGGGTIILPGVSIGDNVTIGAGSIVTESIRSNVLAYGNPCRVIKKI
ncbi:MAG: sugar O-acetyltransferase, partial [Synergistaceae bacterium]|nr:sugar O-acetyltransferase [Synergistaceae bacterium]